MERQCASRFTVDEFYRVIESYVVQGDLLCTSFLCTFFHRVEGRSSPTECVVISMYIVLLRGGTTQSNVVQGKFLFMLFQ